jgi:hypothetical protein
LERTAPSCYNGSMIFYKYFGELGIKVIEDLRLKISPPNEFNDPFELTPRSKFTITIADMVNRAKIDPDHFRGVFEDMRNDGYPHTFERFIAEFPTIIPLKFKEFKKLMLRELMKQDMKSLDEASEKLGILCASKIPNSIPMWSHYADHHKGIAIGLNLPRIGNTPRGPFGKVRYRKFRRGVNLWLAPTNPEWFRQVIDTIFTKSRDWLYEQEYRLVFRLDDLVRSQPDEKEKRHFFLDINGNDIREIIFGSRINKAFKNRVIAELNRRPKTFGHVKRFQCKRHHSRFELEIIPS